MPNFVKIGQSVADILRCFDFSRWRTPTSWIFEFFGDRLRNVGSVWVESGPFPSTKSVAVNILLKQRHRGAMISGSVACCLFSRCR